MLLFAVTYFWLALSKFSFCFLGPPTSCYGVQQQLGVFIDGEHMLMTKDNKYLKVKTTYFISCTLNVFVLKFQKLLAIFDVQLTTHFSIFQGANCLCSDYSLRSILEKTITLLKIVNFLPRYIALELGIINESTVLR